MNYKEFKKYHPTPNGIKAYWEVKRNVKKVFVFTKKRCSACKKQIHMQYAYIRTRTFNHYVNFDIKEYICHNCANTEKKALNLYVPLNK